MRVIIAGSRHYDDYDELCRAMDEFWRVYGFEITEVVSGGAKGADQLGERWALQAGIPVQRFEADWDTHGRGAGPIRNGEMAEYAGALVALPIAQSPGTRNMIRQADREGLWVYIHPSPGHQCHANGCQAVDCHPEAPFCKKHFKMLHPAHQKALWGGRAGGGCCAACEPVEGQGPAEGWWELYNLAVAILLVTEYEKCGFGADMHDDDSGFCWGCGVDQAEATYTRARAAVTKLAAANR